MSDLLATFVSMALKSSVLLLILNEIRGMILTIPVLYGIYQAGGTATAIWIAVSSLAGIALSVAAPLIAARKFKHFTSHRKELRSSTAANV